MVFFDIKSELVVEEIPVTYSKNFNYKKIVSMGLD